MALPLFPNTPGITWPVKKMPGFATQIQSSLAGRRTPVRFQLEPRWSYELKIEFLRNFGGRLEFQNLLNVFAQTSGSYGTFLFDDIDDNAVTDQTIGIGDGANKVFALLRTYAGFNQRVAATKAAPVIKVAGSVVSSGQYTISNTGVVTFTTAPGAGQAVTWTGGYYWVCRFDDDQLDLSQFMSNWWEVSSLKFSTEIIL
jgi:uncharacterized protein (TIGR02217 family)